MGSRNSSIKKFLSRNLLAAFAKNKNLGKLIVIESDDWGSIRMPSKSVFDALKIKIPSIENDVYNKYDTIASPLDLEHIVSSLEKIKDYKGNHPIITCNFITANPDFNKIREEKFLKYYFHPFDYTLQERYGSQLMKLWEEAINKKVIAPAYHGRDHVNIGRWLELLQTGNINFKNAFEHEVFGIVTKMHPPEYIMAALDYPPGKFTDSLVQSLQEGFEIYQRVFNAKPKSFIAPCYVWDNRVEKVLRELDIYSLQGGSIQFLPKQRELSERKYQKKIRIFGSKNKHGQMYLTRNVFFEPASNHGFDWEGDSLKRMETAFKWGIPAIICSHRVNYVGGLNEQNRIKNLSMLKGLLKKSLKIWPDVEFISSRDLIEKIQSRG